MIEKAVGAPRAKFRTYADYLDSVAPDRDRRGRVYFIGAEGGPVKVGYSTNVPERMRGLQTASAAHLKLWAVIEGTPMCEAAWHDVLAADRVRGEWFAVSPKLIDVIRTVRQLSGCRVPLPLLLTPPPGAPR